MTRVVLGVFVDFGFAAHACGVDESDRADFGFDERVDGVSGGAGHVVHDGPLLPHQSVEES